MAIATKNQKWAAKVETTEGVYAAPTASDFIQVLKEGNSISFSRETLERNVFGSGLGKIKPRVGMSSVAAELSCEFRAGATNGAAPEYGPLLKAGLGVEQASASFTTQASGHTTTKIYFATAPSIAKHDIVLIEKAGGFHVSPVIDIGNDATGDFVELLVPMATPLTAATPVKRFRKYTPTNSGHDSLSITQYIEDGLNTVRMKGLGCKVSGIELSNFATGQIPQLKFSLEGMSFDADTTAAPGSIGYSNRLPPILLDARVYWGNDSLCVNEFGLSIENSLGKKMCLNQVNGVESIRLTERQVTVSLDPYTLANLQRFNAYNNNTTFSIFAYAKLPTANAGEFEGIVAVWLPNCSITEMSMEDADGLLKDKLSVQAFVEGSDPEVVIGVY